MHALVAAHTRGAHVNALCMDGIKPLVYSCSTHFCLRCFSFFFFFYLLLKGCLCLPHTFIVAVKLIYAVVKCDSKSAMFYCVVFVF